MLSLAYGLTRASKVLHNKVLYRLIRAPVYFFDSTPLGRITNRLSKDMDAVDVTVPQSLRQCLNSVFNILGTVTVVSFEQNIRADDVSLYHVQWYIIDRKEYKYRYKRDI